MIHSQMALTLLSAIVVTASTMQTVQAEVRYRVRLLEGLQFGTGPNAEPADINDTNQVCGYYDLAPDFRLTHWNLTDGTSIDLGSIGSCPYSGGTPTAINEMGHSVGLSVGFECNTEAWIWTPENGMIGLGSLAGSSFYSRASGINNFDQVVGMSRGPNGYEAFLWHESNGMIGLGEQLSGRFIDAYDINDNTWIVGLGSFVSFDLHVLWMPDHGARLYGEIVKEPPGTLFGGLAINQRGQVAGAAVVNNQYGAGLWDPVSGTTILDCPFCPADTNVVGTDINDRTEIIGYVDLDEFPDEPFIWDELRGMRRINDLIDPCAPWYATRIRPPTGINNHGWIVADILYTGGGDRTIPGAALIPYLPGDVDEDLDVDLHDLTQLLSNFGTPTGATLADGDVEGCDDEDVDLDDLILLLGNFGESYP